MKRKRLLCLTALVLLFVALSVWCHLAHPWHKTPSIHSVSAGESHSLVLLNDGTVWGWGSNSYDQLGIEDPKGSVVPVQLQDLHDICVISAGSNHTVALDAQGFVWTWGQYGSHQTYRLNRGNTVVLSLSKPIILPGLNNIVMVASGNHHSLALDNLGRVWAWGQNGYGQLGDGTVDATSEPVLIKGLDNVVSISAGALHSLALKSDGTVWGWGNNLMRQLGPNLGREVLSPSKIDGVENITQISGGFGHSVALAKDGRVWIWGVIDWTSIPEITDDIVVDQYYDPTLLEFPSPAIAVGSGSDHSIVLLENGQVWAWGTNTFGQLGNGTLFKNIEPSQVMGLPTIRLLAAGGYHNIVVDESGILWGWGLDEDNQVGTSSFIEFYLATSLNDHPELEETVQEPREILNRIKMIGPDLSCPQQDIR